MLVCAVVRARAVLVLFSVGVLRGPGIFMAVFSDGFRRMRERRLAALMVYFAVTQLTPDRFALGESGREDQQ